MIAIYICGVWVLYILLFTQPPTKRVEAGKTVGCKTVKVKITAKRTLWSVCIWVSA